MAAKPCDLWCQMCDNFVRSVSAVIIVKFCLDLFSHFREENFWRLKKKKNNMVPNHMTDDAINFFSVDQFIPKWPSNFFIQISCSVLHMQLRRHNEGSYGVIKKKSTLIPHEKYLPCVQFEFFPWCGFRYRNPKLFFPFCHTTWPMMS